MPGFLFQTIRMAKSARQRRDRERESVRDSVWLRVRDSVVHKIDS
jgi:hypothetical protein